MLPGLNNMINANHSCKLPNISMQYIGCGVVIAGNGFMICRLLLLPVSILDGTK